ncbi:MAG: hypothetical protein KUG75_15310, partial [Pseudomonadales bacterium]|nr:hypothetical protein [Pseudomonadales bacterium]
MQYIHKLAVLIMFALMGSAYCASIESLIMPGPLVSSHSELEESCSDCHDLFDRDAQQALCLGCHERIANDLTKSQGFHFLHPDVKTLQCKQCHTDHKGRETDITGLQPDLFDHTFADFQLRGAHKTLTCDSCHISGDGYFEAPSECIQCHKLNDLHQGALGDKCGDCHTQSDWESAKFDHSTTDFSLIG